MTVLPSLLGVLVALLVGCSTTGGDWDRARKNDSVQSYRRFVAAHPGSEYAGTAAQRIHEIQWQEAAAADTAAAYLDFLQASPSGKWHAEAESRLELRLAPVRDRYREYVRSLERQGSDDARLEAWQAVLPDADLLLRYALRELPGPASGPGPGIQGGVSERVFYLPETTFMLKLQEGLFPGLLPVGKDLEGGDFIVRYGMRTGAGLERRHGVDRAAVEIKAGAMVYRQGALIQHTITPAAKMGEGCGDYECIPERAVESLELPFEVESTLVKIIGFATELTRKPPQFPVGLEIELHRAVFQASDDFPVFFEAAKRLRRLANAADTPDRDRVRAVKALFSGKSGNISLWNIRTSLGSRNNAALLAILVDTDYADQDRVNAAKALGYNECSEAVGPLIDMLSDRESSLRRAAAFALGEIHDPRAIGALVKALEDKQDYVRSEAAEALGRYGDAAPVDILLQQLDSPDDFVREAVIEALGNIANPDFIPALISQLSAKTGFVRDAAIEALTKIGGRRAREALQAALHNDNPQVRKAAVNEYVEQPKRCRHDNTEVTCQYRRRMIANKDGPALIATRLSHAGVWGRTCVPYAAKSGSRA